MKRRSRSKFARRLRGRWYRLRNWLAAKDHRVRIIAPSINLGCLGFQIGDGFYADFYDRKRTDRRLPGLYLRTCGRRIWITTDRVRVDQ